MSLTTRPAAQRKKKMINQTESTKTPFTLKLLRMLLVFFSIVLAACATMQAPSSDGENIAVQTHELFDGDVDTLALKSKQLKDHRSGTSFDKEPFDDLTEAQITERKKFHYIQNGDMALRAGDSDMALYDYVRALMIDGKNLQIFYKIGSLHESRNNTRLASLAYHRALEIQPNFVLVLERLGRMKLNEREYSDARIFFDKAIAEDRQRIDSMEAVSGENRGTDHYSPFYAYTGMGVLEDLNKQHDKALMYYKRSLDIRPNSASAENNIGYSYYLKNDQNQAEAHFKRAISRDKTYSKAWRNLALVYVKRGEFSEAVELLTDQTGNEASAYNTVGYICMIDGKYDQAERYFNRAIDLSPAYFEIAVQNRDLNRRRHSKTVYEALN